jgi:hypothetical protein
MENVNGFSKADEQLLQYTEKQKLRNTIHALSGIVDQQKRTIEQQNSEIATLKYTIVATVGGVDYKGFRTSKINWLQRLRILLEKEKENTALRSAIKAAIDSPHCYEAVCFGEAKKVLYTVADGCAHGHRCVAAMLRLALEEIERHAIQRS